MPKSKADTTVVRCGSETNAYLMYMAAFRYAFGSTTYMPSTVVEIIKANADSLSDRLLSQLDKELSQAEDDYERLWKDKHPSNYGSDFDREMWLGFHKWVKSERDRRAGANG